MSTLDLYFILIGVCSAIFLITYAHTRNDVFMIAGLVLIVPFVGWFAINPARLVIVELTLLSLNLYLHLH
jgi:hypothetical protein